MRIPFSRNVRLAAVAAATALSLTTLAACGGSSDSGGDASLEMWTFKQSHVGALRNAAAEFKKQTGISVKVEAYTPDDAYTTKVQSAAKTGDLPDVLEVHSDGEDRVFGAAGILADISDDFKGEWAGRIQQPVQQSGLVTEQRFKDAQPETARDHGIEKGARYSVPLTVGTFGIVYANKKMLAEAGITEPPADWAGFLDALKATTVRNPTTGGLALGLKIQATGLTWVLQPLAFSQLGQQGYEALFGQDESADFASPNGIKVLSLYDQLTPYWMPGTQSLTIDEADQAFAQGKAAFDVGGTFTLAFLQQNGMSPDDVLAFALPSVKDGAVPDRALGPLALTGLGVSATSDQPGNAKKWMEFLSTQKAAAQFAKDASDVPATELGADSATVLGPALSAMVDSFKGNPQNTYDPNRGNEFRAPGYEQDDAGAILADLTPLKQKSVEETARQLRELNASYWAAAR
ncbi:MULTISPECIES: extracellular solute-binding protein [unclassified Streptomyces]|uniref:ABC transporter substrate-binding protein n=1 Tax=unclassified Streptomyces TaxID=2593676 RepID=UPI00081F12D9|nr:MULTISPECIES: extracellular solute-binding protein [unclassified Streptomyces]MYZ38447.1 extracellular solute-binding protein [Streptomyces sp. SID4917]SCF98526.1 multiple sugar transport system substrate-binding protein [Streptomyces sp. MnatMP-M17]